MIWIIVGIAAFLCVAVAVISYICFRMAFYASAKKPSSDDILDLPQGDIYEPYRDYMESCAREVQAMPCKHL